MANVIKKIGIMPPSYIVKAKKTFHFVDEIISIENIGPEKSAYGQRACYDRLKVIYKFNNKTQSSVVSSRLGGRK